MQKQPQHLPHYYNLSNIKYLDHNLSIVTCYLTVAYEVVNCEWLMN